MDEGRGGLRAAAVFGLRAALVGVALAVPVVVTLALGQSVRATGLRSLLALGIVVGPAMVVADVSRRSAPVRRYGGALPAVIRARPEEAAWPTGVKQLVRLVACVGGALWTLVLLFVARTAWAGPERDTLSGTEGLLLCTLVAVGVMAVADLLADDEEGEAPPTA